VGEKDRKKISKERILKRTNRIPNPLERNKPKRSKAKKKEILEEAKSKKKKKE